MDQDKIGKLIAKLRKEKGMTQRELGDKVGVGFKAVSKWERGITCPDISIVNELSKILGITSDELLSGELSKERINDTRDRVGRRINKKLLLIIAIFLFVGLFVFMLCKINNEKADVYVLASNSDEYQVEGKVILNNKTFTLYINNLRFNDAEFCKTIIKNYDYKIYSNNKILMSYGYSTNSELLSSKITIKVFLNSFVINYVDEIIISNRELVDNGIVLEITFLDVNDELITKNVQIGLRKGSI